MKCDKCDGTGKLSGFKVTVLRKDGSTSTFNVGDSSREMVSRAIAFYLDVPHCVYKAEPGDKVIIDIL